MSKTSKLVLEADDHTFSITSYGPDGEIKFQKSGIRLPMEKAYFPGVMALINVWLDERVKPLVPFRAEKRVNTKRRSWLRGLFQSKEAANV